MVFSCPEAVLKLSRRDSQPNEGSGTAAQLRGLPREQCRHRCSATSAFRGEAAGNEW